MWCENCGKEYGDTPVCPDCGSKGIQTPKLNWGSSAPGEIMEKWPKTAEGEPVKPVFLVHRSNVGMEDEMTANLLEAYGIPALRRYPNDGDFGRLILGVSGSGTDIFVPETMREEALLLIEGED
ncbi:MAG: hypothetical protein AB7D36_10480 [Oscillospiraceae bacterium]